MSRTAVLLLVALIAVGCGSSNDAAGSEPVKRYLVYEKLVGEKGVWIADTDGSSPRLLVPDARAPVISPDGKSVAYVGGCSAEDICKGTYVISTSGGKPRGISSDRPTFPPAAFTWSPDSKRLLLSRGSTPFERELVSIAVADSRTLTIAKGQLYGASFSPDGQQLVYSKATPATARSGEDAFDLFVVPSDGGKPKRITHTGDKADPVWGRSRSRSRGSSGTPRGAGTRFGGSTPTAPVARRSPARSSKCCAELQASTVWCRLRGPTTATPSSAAC